MQGRDGKGWAVELVGWNAVESFDEVFGREISAFCDRFADDQLGQHRARCDRRPAADGVIFGCGNAVDGHFEVEDHEGTAAWGAGVDGEVGVLDRSAVARRHDVVGEGFGEFGHRGRRQLLVLAVSGLLVSPGTCGTFGRLAT
jgi:hypothetical protein